MRPSDFNLPAKFGEWRPHQFDAVCDITAADTRFVGSILPVGSGKTAIYMAEALTSPGRTCILVSTKGLQDQGGRDFKGLTCDIRGQANYPCELERPRKVGCDKGACHVGYFCSFKASGCAYYDKVRAALRAKIVWTNYAYWMSSYAYGEGLGNFNTLVLDEAHDAYGHLSDFVSVRISDIMVDAYLQGEPPPTNRAEWARWVRTGLFHVEPRLKELREAVEAGDRTAIPDARELSRLYRSLAELGSLEPARWIMTDTKDDGVTTGWTWQPIWAGGYAESCLFRGIPRVILTSATIREKTLDLLHVPKDKRTILEYGSSFPKARRPVYLVRNVRVSKKTPPEGMRALVDKVDQIIEPRQNLKGVIHTVSYDLMKFIREHSRFRDLMLTHYRRNTADTVMKFKMARRGVLMSPAMTTGWDFPGDECRWQIIVKIPFPYGLDPLVQAREKEDKRYASYTAMTNIVQASGRGMRSADDWCETFIIDDHFRDWFLRRNKDFAPRWFLEACQMVNSVPRPLKL
jgi:ATP-dependent DNA helicase DinG